MSKSRIRKSIAHAYRGARIAWHKLEGRNVVHFLHVSKTGGSAIKYALNGASYYGQYIVYTHHHRFALRDVPSGEGFIFFVRDPIRRFVSGFYSRQRQGRPRIFDPWSPAEREAFCVFQTPNELAMALSSSVADSKNMAEKAMGTIGHVKDSYWRWFESEAYFRSRMTDLFFVGFQEQLADDFKIMKRKLMLNDDAVLPSDDVAAHRTPKGLDTNLEQEAIDNLRKWYKRDYEFVALCTALRGQDSGTAAREA